MARPLKPSIDYFPLNCHMNDSMSLIQANFGLIGFAVVIKLWQKIYSSKGYFTEWDNDVALLFAHEHGAGVNVVKEIVQSCLSKGIFDRKLYEQYGILTSEGIQNRYAEATAKRRFVLADNRYLLIPTPKNWVLDGNSIPIDDFSEVCDGTNTQSKENKSKENKSKSNYNYRAGERESASAKKKSDGTDGSFDTDSFFELAVKRSLGEID